MTKKSKSEITIASDTVLLDIVSRWPATEMVFHRYDEKAGVCLCCTCLFDTIEDIACRHRLDLGCLMREIRDAAEHKSDDRDAARTYGNALISDVVMKNACI